MEYLIIILSLALLTALLRIRTLEAKVTDTEDTVLYYWRQSGDFQEKLETYTKPPTKPIDQQCNSQLH